MNLNIGPDYPIILLAFVIGITVHEFGHAFMAVLCGDDTPKLQGRLTLNPIDHLDPIGTIFLAVTAFLGLGTFGWGKPVMVNTANLKSPRWSMLWVAIMGPVMSLSLSVSSALLVRFDAFHLASDGMYHDIFVRMFDVNLMLFLFNLIPIPPLDGSKILSALLPINQAVKYDKFVGALGPSLFMFAILAGGYLIQPVMLNLRPIILGPDF